MASEIATQEEIDEVKKLFKKVSKPIEQFESKPQITPALPQSEKYIRDKDLFKQFAQVTPTRSTGLGIDNPVEWLFTVKPNFVPYKWQVETLLHFAGYLGIHNGSKEKSSISDQNPLMYVLSAANGSGKDMVIIAAFATWFAIEGLKNRIIITSASHEQLHSQTEVHIIDFARCANKVFPGLFRSVKFHHIVPDLGSEIKLYVTDEEKRAEGFHPFDGGKMALIMNEAKSISDSMFDALRRCTGYSHWIMPSSPGRKSGFMYRCAGSATHYPNTPQLAKYFYRRVSAYECPHIAKAHIEQLKEEKGENSPLFRSSVLAEFSDFDEPVVITEADFDTCKSVTAQGDDIGIGLDIGAGIDTTCVIVRRGNKQILYKEFNQADTTVTPIIVDNFLSSYKNLDYVFRADNGGVSQAVVDSLIKLGWNVQRCNNQSPARNKREFLNRGAEMWFYVKRLFQRREIIPGNNPKLRQELTTRYYRGFDSTQGKLALESKAEARANGRPSPNQADAFVLCFSSYKHTEVKVERQDNLVSTEEMLLLAFQNRLFQKQQIPQGRFTLLK